MSGTDAEIRTWQEFLRWEPQTSWGERRAKWDIMQKCKAYRVWERQRAGRAHLMEQMSKKNSRRVSCQKRGKEEGSLLVVKLQHHQCTNQQLMDQPLEKELPTSGILLCESMCVYVSSTYYNNLRKWTVISLHAHIFYNANHCWPDWCKDQARPLKVIQLSDTKNGCNIFLQRPPRGTETHFD